MLTLTDSWILFSILSCLFVLFSAFGFSNVPILFCDVCSRRETSVYSEGMSCVPPAGESRKRAALGLYRSRRAVASAAVTATTIHSPADCCLIGRPKATRVGTFRVSCVQLDEMVVQLRKRRRTKMTMENTNTHHQGTVALSQLLACSQLKSVLHGRAPLVWEANETVMIQSRSVPMCCNDTVNSSWPAW